MTQFFAEHLLGHRLLQGLQPLGVWPSHAAELAPPEVGAGFGESMASTQIVDRDPALRLPSKPNNLDR